MAKTLFATGQQVVLDDTQGVITTATTSSFIIRTEFGRTLTLSHSALYKAYNAGRLKHFVDTEPPTGRTYLRPDEAELVQKLLAYLRPMAESQYPGSKKQRLDIIRRVATQRGDDTKDVPSEITLFKWFKRWDAHGRDVLALLPRNRQQKRQSRVSKQFKELMDEAIDEHYLKLNGYSVQETYTHFLNRCKSLKVQERPPSRQTFYAYVKRIHPLDRLKMREGAAAVRRESRVVEQEHLPRKPMELVEIDAVHLNLGLLDDNDHYLGKLVVFFAIDVFSRAILGVSYVVALSPGENAEGVIECLKMVMKVKTREEFPYLENDWLMGGLPEMVSVDPSLCLLSNSITSFLGSHGISRYTTQASQPWRKPHIERFFRTLRGELCRKLPGYYPKRTANYVVKNTLKDEACLRREEFEQCLYSYIVDGYHQSPHRGLNGETPHEVWCKGAEMYPPEYVDDLSFANNFGAQEAQRVLDQNRGIWLNNIRYNSRELNALYGRQVKTYGDKYKASLRWSGRDVSKIFVLDPQEGSYFSVPSVKAIPPDTSLAAFKAVHKAGGTTNNLRRNPVNDEFEPVREARKRLNARKKAKRVRSHPPTTPASKLTTEELEAQLGAESVPGHKIPSAPESESVLTEEPVSTGRRKVDPHAKGFRVRRASL